MSAKSKLDRTVVGVLLGILGTGAGFLLLALWWSWRNGESMGYFIEKIFVESALYKDRILTASVLFNVFVFYGLLRANWEKTARGIMIIILISVPLIVWIQANTAFA